MSAIDVPLFISIKLTLTQLQTLQSHPVCCLLLEEEGWYGVWRESALEREECAKELFLGRVCESLSLEASHMIADQLRSMFACALATLFDNSSIWIEPLDAQTRGRLQSSASLLEVAP